MSLSAVSCVMYWTEYDIRQDAPSMTEGESVLLANRLLSYPLTSDGRRIVIGVRKWSYDDMPGHPLEFAAHVFVNEWRLSIGDKWDLFGYRVN